MQKDTETPVETPVETPEDAAARAALIAALRQPGGLMKVLDGLLAALPEDERLFDVIATQQILATHAMAMQRLRDSETEAEEPLRAAARQDAIRLLALSTRQMNLRERRRTGREKDAAAAAQRALSEAERRAREADYREGVAVHGPGYDPDDPDTWVGPFKVIWEDGPAPERNWPRARGEWSRPGHSDDLLDRLERGAFSHPSGAGAHGVVPQNSGGEDDGGSEGR